MKHWLYLLMLCLAMTGLHCTQETTSTSEVPTESSKPKEKPTLNVFIWSDYVDPALVEAFEEKHQCKVNLNFFESNEQLLAKIKAGGAAYDVLYPSGYAVQTMVKEDLLLPLDHNKIPNLANVDRTYSNLIADPSMKCSVPYMVSTTGIGYLAELGDLEPTWAVLGDPKLKGRVTLLNDIREVIGVALKLHGYSLNTTDEAELAKAAETAIAWKRNAARFDSTQYHYGLAGGEFKLVQGYSGDVLQAQKENPEIRFMLPKEGFPLTCDEMAIAKTSRHPDLAHAWINYFHEGEVAARNTMFIKYLCPNTASYDKLPAEVKNNQAVFPPPEAIARAEIVRDVGADLAAYTKIWDTIKAAE